MTKAYVQVEPATDIRLAAMREVNEGTALVVTARFLSDGEAFVPGTVHYKLMNVTTGETVIDWTAATPASSLEIEISAMGVEVRNDCNRYEVQEITVVSDKDTPDQSVQVRRWKVRNIRAFN